MDPTQICAGGSTLCPWGEGVMAFLFWSGKDSKTRRKRPNVCLFLMEQTRLHTEETNGQATQGNSAWRTGMSGPFALSLARDSMRFFTLGKMRCFIFTL